MEDKDNNKSRILKSQLIHQIKEEVRQSIGEFGLDYDRLDSGLRSLFNSLALCSEEQSQFLSELIRWHEYDSEECCYTVEYSKIYQNDFASDLEKVFK